VWNETFIIDIVDRSQDIVLDVYDYDFGSSDDFMGQFTLKPEAMSQELVDEWIPLQDRDAEKEKKKKKKERGDLHLRHHFITYGPITRALLSADLALAKAYLNVPLTDDSTRAFVEYYAGCGRILPLLLESIDSEVLKTENPTQLFRLDSVTTKLAASFAGCVAARWLQTIAGPIISSLGKAPSNVEIDDERVPSDEKVAINRAKMQHLAETLLSAVTASADRVPGDLRVLARRIAHAVESKFPDHRLKAVGGILFLRFICPALIRPQLFFSDPPSPELQRALVLLSKVVQNVANGVQFGAKEQFMIHFNDLVVAQMAKVDRFLEEVASDRNSTGALEPDRQRLSDALRLVDDMALHMDMHWEKLISHLPATHQVAAAEVKAWLSSFCPLVRQQRNLEAADEGKEKSHSHHFHHSSSLHT